MVNPGNGGQDITLGLLDNIMSAPIFFWCGIGWIMVSDKVNMTDKTSLRLTEEQRVRLQRLLFPGDGREAVVLALCGTLSDSNRLIFCIHEIIEVPLDACVLRTEIAVRWDVKALVPVLQKALKRGLWVLKIHSHPKDYEQFSTQDDQTDLELAKGIEAILERSPSLI